MKRLIILVVLTALCAGLFTGCVRPPSKYSPGKDAGKHKWVCDELDMWFLAVERGRNTYFLGELTLDGETVPIEVSFPIGSGRSLLVYRFFGFDDMVYALERQCFTGEARYYKGWFRLQIDERFVDKLGFETLTFRRVELDEADRAWIEAQSAANGAAASTPVTAV